MSGESRRPEAANGGLRQRVATAIVTLNPFTLPRRIQRMREELVRKLRELEAQSLSQQRRMDILEQAVREIQQGLEELRDRRMPALENRCDSNETALRRSDSEIERLRDAVVPAAARRGDVLIDRVMSEVEEIGSLVERMLRREPLQVLSGQASFDREAAKALEELQPQLLSAFRGSEGEIHHRLEPYLRWLSDAAPVLDLGSGRGELLALLREKGISATGIEQDAALAQAALRRGLDVISGEVLAVLGELPGASRGAVTAIHLFEHLAAETIVRVLAEIRRVLVPGGVVLIECPNPHSLRVGASLFWLDPSHVRPLPPETLELLVTAGGLEIVTRELLHPFPEERAGQRAAGLRYRRQTMRGAGRRFSMRAIGFGLICVVALGCGQNTATRGGGDLTIRADVDARRAQFVQKIVHADVSYLSDGDQSALAHLIGAARVIDEIFRVQAWTGNPELSQDVAALTGAQAKAAQDYYRIMYGPWDRLTGFEPFLGNAEHPPGAGYYPEDLTRDELEAWLEAHPESRQEMTSLYTVVRRSEKGGLFAEPYSKAYGARLERAARELRLAAGLTENESLKRFLELRADAFLSDDYFESDMAWMDLDSAIEVVIGPYETYEDGLFGYKAAFEAFVCVAQPEESQRLASFKEELPFLERNLPIPDVHKNLERGAESPIRVVHEVFTAGECRAGVQTLAFNLPNDERVRQIKGSKKVLLKNMMQAKYEAILEPIAERVLPVDSMDNLDFDAYFLFTLSHEMAHGLGPGIIVVDGRETEVRLELRDLDSALEEAKADVLGIYNLYALAGRGLVSAQVIEHLPWTYVAGLFRSARFGTTEAHGLGVVIQAAFLLDSGALEVTPAGRFEPVPDRFPAAIKDLANRILMIQALGSYEGAAELVASYGTLPPAMAAALAGLGDIPVDVDPEFRGGAAL
jgi:SAM-dependent methyltransferase